MFQFADRSMKLFKGRGITNRKKESSGNKTKFWVTDAVYLKEISGGSFTLKAGRLYYSLHLHLLHVHPLIMTQMNTGFVGFLANLNTVLNFKN